MLSCGTNGALKINLDNLRLINRKETLFFHITSCSFVKMDDYLLISVHLHKGTFE